MKKQPGFTLIEIAVVIVIITGLIGGLLIPVKEYYRQTKIELTQQRLEEIKEALLNFAVINGYLPCPAKDDISGKEPKRDTTTDEHICKTYDNSDGYLPWATLGVGEYYDGWGQPFRYRVDGWFSNSNGIFKEDAPSVGRTKYLLKVTDRQGNLLNVPNYTDPDSGINFNSNIVAIIFSYGKNAQPEQGTDINNYIQDVYVENQFDDILIWVPKYVLINRLAAAGKWPPK